MNGAAKGPPHTYTHALARTHNQIAEGGKKKKKGGPKGIKKKEATGAGGKVVIMRMSRNKRKSITVITGLDTYPGKEGSEGVRERGRKGRRMRRGMCVLDPGVGRELLTRWEISL